MSGWEIFRKREEIRAFRQPSCGSADDPFSAYKTTEINVTSEIAGFPIPRAPVNCFDKEDHHSHPTVASKDYEPYSTTINSSAPNSDLDPLPRHSSHATSAIKRYKELLDDNTATFNYTKVALLFFTSLCVTWIPSSVNRIYDLVHPNAVSYSLNFISAIVLPLMGFWNAVIYFATTHTVCATIFWDQMERWAPKKRSARIARSSRSINESHSLRTSRVGGGSMTEGLVLTSKETGSANAV
ncbi:MAG: hypothetical protein Q9186_000749 [Xanthomendoza sp. 1 TL-2023]